MKNNKGFSLVELIVVIAIMAILAAVAIPTFGGFITKANKAADQDFMAQTEYVIELAHVKDIDKDVVAVQVNLANDGKTITSVEYKLTGDTAFRAVAKGTTYTDERADIVGAIDFDYKFKAKDSIAGTVDGVAWTIVIANTSTT